MSVMPASMIEAIWSCALEDLQHEMKAPRVPLDKWLATKVTVLCESPELYEWFVTLADSVNARRHAPLVPRPAFTPEQVAIERMKAIGACRAQYLHFCTGPFQYDPLGLELIADELQRVKPELASFEVTFKAGPIHTLSAGLLMRRHGVPATDGRSPQPLSLTETLVSQQLASRLRTNFATAPPREDWGQLLVRLLRSATKDELHIPLFAGFGRRRRRPLGSWVRQSVHPLNLLRLELPDVLRSGLWPQAGGPAKDVAQFVSRQHRFVIGLHILGLARELSPNAGEMIRETVAIYLASILRAVRAEIALDPKLALALLGEIADTLGLTVFEHTDLLVGECVEMLERKLTDESMIGTDRLICALVEGLVRKSQEELQPGEDPRETQNLRSVLRRQAQLEQQLRFWRAECSRQMQLATEERRRNVSIEASIRAMKKAEGKAVQPRAPDPT